MNEIPIETINEFLLPQKWWFLASLTQKFIIILLTLAFFSSFGLCLFKKLSRKKTCIIFIIISIIMPVLLYNLYSNVIVFPGTLVFDQNRDIQKEIYIINKADRPKYSISILLDIDSLDSSQIKIDIPKEYTVNTNDFDSSSMPVLFKFNITTQENKKYIWITKNKIPANSEFPIYITAHGGNIKVKETKFSYQETGVYMNPNNSEESIMPSLHLFSTFKKNEKLTISGMKVILMKN